MSTSPRPAWLRRPEVWIVLATVLLRLLVLARFSGTPWFLQQKGDMLFYHSWAERILAGEWSDGKAFYGLPGYAFLLAGIYKVAGASALTRTLAVSLLQIALESATAVVIFRIASVLCKSDSLQAASPPLRARLIFPALASLAWITFVPAQTFSTILMPTAWVVCAWWWGVALAMRRGETRWWWPWLPAGVAIGVVSMLVATITFLVPLLVARMGLSVAASQPWARRAPRLALAMVGLVTGMFAGSAPAWIHNYFVAHDPVLLSAHGGLNFYMGNNPEATGYPKIPPGLRSTQEGLLRDSITWAEKVAGHPLRRSEVSAFWSEKAHRYIVEHPAEWRALLLRKVRNFWNAFPYDDLSVITLLQTRGVLLPGLSWGLAAALGLAGGLLGLGFSRPARWVAAAVLLYAAAILPVFITERYRLAAAPGLLILGAWGLWRLWAALCARQWAVTGLWSTLALGSAFLVSLPVQDPTLWSLDPFNVGVKELDLAETLPLMDGSPEEKQEHREEAADERARAAAHLLQAWQWVQSDPGIVFALGNLALDEGQRPAARQRYLRALSLNPRFTGALNNLGIMAMDDQDWAAAEALLRSALQEEPENATRWYLLAKARREQGNVAGAREALEEALRRRPGQREFLELQRALEAASAGAAP